MAKEVSVAEKKRIVPWVYYYEDTVYYPEFLSLFAKGFGTHPKDQNAKDVRVPGIDEFYQVDTHFRVPSKQTLYTLCTQSYSLIILTSHLQHREDFPSREKYNLKTPLNQTVSKDSARWLGGGAGLTLDFIEQIRASDKNKNTPIVVTSTNMDVDKIAPLVEMYVKAGANKFHQLYGDTKTVIKNPIRTFIECLRGFL